MKVDTYAVIDLFGKNVQVKKVFWTLFVMMDGLILALVVEPVTTHQVVGIIAGGVKCFLPIILYRRP